MLETERKPDKLATAMEARARLAATGDERRIARQRLSPTRLIEPWNWPEINSRFHGSESRQDFRNRGCSKLLASFATELISGLFLSE